MDAVKATTEQTKAATAQIYVDMQVLDPSEVRAGLKKSEEYTINDLLNEEDDLDLAGLLGIGSPENEETVTEEAQNSVDNTEGILSVDDKTKAPRGCEKVTGTHGDNGTAQGEGVGVLVITDGKVLTGIRTDGKGICGPGGHIEPGEDPETAARRETGEEFGIIPLELIPLGKTADRPPELSSRVFLCTRYEQQPRADNEEMMNSRFMSLTELLYGDVKLFGPFEDSLRLLIEELGMRRDEGNSNSGNHNHKGRPGQLGGSGGGGSSLGKPLSAQKSKEYEKKIVGQRTSKGVTIKKLSKHTCDRCGQRRLSADKVREVVQHPETVKRDTTHDGNKFRYQKGRVIAVVDHDDGEIVTVFKH